MVFEQHYLCFIYDMLGSLSSLLWTIFSRHFAYHLVQKDKQEEDFNLEKGNRRHGRDLMEKVEIILEKGNFKLDKGQEIMLSQLRKRMRGEDDAEELRAAIELLGPVEQKQGKRSDQYMFKMYLDIELALRVNDVEKKKELVEQTEELI